MKRPTRHADGHYHINGKKYPQLIGSREQVRNGTAYKTEGGLLKSNLFTNKWGRIVSLKKHRTAKKEMRLRKYGFYAKKGQFGYVKKSVRTRKMKGGASVGAELSSAYPSASVSAAAAPSASISGSVEGKASVSA
jgi:DVNP family